MPIPARSSSPEAVHHDVPARVSAWVTPARLARLKKQIKSFQRRAQKLGLAPLELEEGETRVVRIGARQEVQGKHQVLLRQAFPVEKALPGGWHEVGLTRQHHITLTGEVPRLAGWRFVAAIEHMEKGNVVYATPGANSLPERFLTTPCTCEHCNTRRNRTRTYVVAQGDEYIQVGKSCLEDFVGHKNAEALAALAEWQSNFWAEVACEDADEYLEESCRVHALISVEGFLPYVVADVRRDGFTSRTQAETDASLVSTADSAFYNYRKHNPIHTEADVERAREIIAWAQGLSDEDAAASGFLNNIRVLAREQAVPPRHLGTVAAMVPAYDRAMRQNQQVESPSVWQGTPRERETFDGLYVERVIPRESAYGITHIHRMVDPAGNVFVWYASKAALEQGKTYDVKATVKKHDEYKGVKQTVITRAAAREAEPSVDASEPEQADRPVVHAASDDGYGMG